MELRPTIDRAWLEEAARRDPLAHAYAIWDLTHLPASVRFVSAVEHGETVGYLLVWWGRPETPVVHWSGDTLRSLELVHRLPAPPFVAVVPPAAERAVRSVHPSSESVPILELWREAGPAGPTDPEGFVRRLTRHDVEELRAWNRRPGSERPGYGSVDPAEEPVWGAFEKGRLVGLCRAAVRLPWAWVLSGVYVDPESRGHGLGRRLVGAFVEAAEAAGAPTGLYVREDAGAARRVYASLGYREVGRRVWIEVGAVKRSRPRAVGPEPSGAP